MMKKQILFSAIIFSIMSNVGLAMEKTSNSTGMVTVQHRSEFWSLSDREKLTHRQRISKEKAFFLNSDKYHEQCSFFALLKPHCYFLGYKRDRSYNEWRIAINEENDAERAFTQYLSNKAKSLANS